jgi:hypothetical protein
MENLIETTGATRHLLFWARLGAILGFVFAIALAARL